MFTTALQTDFFIPVSLHFMCLLIMAVLTMACLVLIWGLQLKNDETVDEQSTICILERCAGLKVKKKKNRKKEKVSVV